MNGNINAEAARPRPLSGGIWTFFSWLRRDDHSLSSESISSAGSDRTAVSFAFLEPLKYKAAVEPIVLPPLSPPTDSYRKRVRDKNFRRQRERDITLHRKYGLYKGENSNDRYDAFSLPSARRDISNNIEKTERGRRATSEIFQRRAPYVPGKRRAPLPPAVTNSLPRNFSRKRPAPKPPNKFISNVNIKSLPNETMNSKADCGSNSSSNTNVDLDNKTAKSVKQEKNKSEKSFLKQIFDNRKRNSSIETNYVKLLPNISELDEQAAKIIENKKLKLLESHAHTSSNSDNNSILSVEKWICPTCFKKYNNATSHCLYCRSNRNQLDDSSKSNIKNVATNICTQTDNTELANVASTSKQSEYDEKKKLKEMLKEMKDSLPKRPKQYITETPTLRIGSTSDTMQKSVVKSEANFESDNIIDNSLDQLKQLNVDKNVNAVSTKKTTGISITTNAVFQTSSNGLCTNSPLNKITTSYVTKAGLEKDFKDKGCITICQNSVPNDLQKTTGPSTTKEFLLQSQSKDLSQKQKNKIREEKNNENVDTTLNVDRALDQKLQNNADPSIKPKVSGFSATFLVQPLSSKEGVHFKPEPILTRSENSPKEKLVASANTRKAEENVSKLSPPNSISQDKNLHCYKTEINTKLDMPKNISSRVDSKLHTPLRISSLLNPVYNPIQSTTKKTFENVNGTSNSDPHKLNEPSTSTLISQMPELSLQKPSKDNREISINKEKEDNKQYSTNTSVCKVLGVTPTSSKHQPNHILDKIDHHSRRREIVNQLEKSIAKGDEQAAADAAIKLAKLRLSCSVLSFSSQIIGKTTENTKVEVSSVKTNGNETKKVPTPSVLVMPVQDKVDSKSISQDHILVKNNDKVYQSTSPPTKGKIMECNEIKSNRNITANNVKRESPKLQDNPEENKIVSIQIWVEDKEATRGPISIAIRRKATMGELRLQAETSLGLDSRLQRWIVGRSLCSDDTTPLSTLAGPELNSPFYLCVVETETKKETINQALEQDQVKTPVIKKRETGEVYTELMKLEQQAIIPNTDGFVCEVCMDECETGKGAVLRECLHSFCRECLSDVVRHCEEPVVSCPTMGCPGIFQDREIRALLSTEDYERWLARGLATAECGTRNAFHCRTRDCSGWAFCEPGVRKFPCPVCKGNNCVPCQAIHEGESCEQYQLKLRTAVTAAQTNETDESTEALLNSLIRRGEALTCPECLAIITKKWGCDWVKCSACKTEICWVTRGRRWGPGGRGDTSAGCKCGVDGKRCHPSCGYCH